MNLNNLKPAWRQFKLINSMDETNKDEILALIEEVENVPINRLPGIVVNSLMILVLIICCQGG
ncbi:hypothetical protein [Arthrospiribacter ruber]|uniref:Uncharacterized protein n=1 Tax=Arthrospiribacter ruber TaxID=2487934 RepID=A0A951MD79_9BACT|nr:hypothetical protein [Arthrospiribacter ruber]MBW3467016.1 hypothetical protein [Arthrospiribacter ruber]